MHVKINSIDIPSSPQRLYIPEGKKLFSKAMLTQLSNLQKGEHNIDVELRSDNSQELYDYWRFVINIANEYFGDNNPPVADFTSDVTAIYTGESVQFTDLSTTNPTSWQWDFGDGGSSSLQNPTHTFSSAGVYNVSLTVTNEGGSDTEIKYNYITVTEGSGGGIVTDYDGNKYSTVQIGDQVWMQENLKVTHYSDGTPILKIESQLAYHDLGDSDKAYFYYNNNSDYGNVYGAQYTWAAATNGVGSSLNPSGVQGVCPIGWHMPSDAEWKELEVYLGMSQEEADDPNYRGNDVGGKLKQIINVHCDLNHSVKISKRFTTGTEIGA